MLQFSYNYISVVFLTLANCNDQ